MLRHKAKKYVSNFSKLLLVVEKNVCAAKTNKQLQASSGLLYDVFARFEPDSLLLKQAHREVLSNQLDQHRLRATLARLQQSRIVINEIARPTPFAFPLLVDRLREKLSSEKLADRIRRMQVALEKEVEKEFKR